MLTEEVEMLMNYYKAINLLMEINNYYMERAKNGDANDKEQHIQLCKFVIKLNNLIIEIKKTFSDFSD